MTSARPALRERHVERVEHELGAQMRRHRPADDAPAPRIEHDGEIEKAGPGRDVGDVGDPELVGAGRGEVALDEIGRRARVAIADVVVTCRLRRLTPAKPAARISRATACGRRGRPALAQLGVDAAPP